LCLLQTWLIIRFRGKVGNLENQNDEKILEQLNRLREKVGVSGTDIASYLEGLNYSKLTTYWDYIHLETLLSLQTPKTDQPDEVIFIAYHQITELYFKLILSELQQVCNATELAEEVLANKLERINRYVEQLVSSFDVMTKGMEREQFLKFRLSILPASGFQSVQFRMMEIYSTDLYNLVDKDLRESLEGDHITEELYDHIYWKQGATEVVSGEKTITLKHFEEKYSNQLLALCLELQNKNLNRVVEEFVPKAQNKERLVELLREFDVNVNINWSLAHYKSAVKHLHNKQNFIASTGGTNWQQYLPPRFQKKTFFPSLWTDEEMNDWGKSWVDDVMVKA
jgi:tryptophan 2,3-dioxygenase